MTSRYNAKNKLAPYRSFKPMTFFSDVYPNGTYSANVMGCNWTCDHCWSGFGWRTVDATMELTPSQVVDKLIRGMKKNLQTMCRITGGEPTMYWEHTREVIDLLLGRTRGLKMNVPGLTSHGGEPMGIIVETNGSMLFEDRLLAIENDWGPEAKRLLFSVGVKATHPELLAELTGMEGTVVERMHQRQMDALFTIAGKCEYIGLFASFIEKFTDPRVYAALQRVLENLRPGIGRGFDSIRFKAYNSNRYYVPKKLRVGEFPEEIPADDDEMTFSLVDEQGEPRQDLPAEERPVAQVEDVSDADRDTEERRELVAAAKTIDGQGFPEGEMRR